MDAAGQAKASKGEVRAPRRPMGDLESAIMDVLWDQGGWRVPGEVHAVLDRQRPIAYTTVLTVLVRLSQKGRLERRRDGRAYAYRALQTRQEHIGGRMGDLLVSAGDRPGTLSRFLDSLAPSDRDQLRRMLQGRNGE